VWYVTGPPRGHETIVQKLLSDPDVIEFEA
jgi:hypothetical protein